MAVRWWCVGCLVFGSCLVGWLAGSCCLLSKYLPRLIPDSRCRLHYEGCRVGGLVSPLHQAAPSPHPTHPSLHHSMFNLQVQLRGLPLWGPGVTLHQATPDAVHVGAAGALQGLLAPAS